MTERERLIELLRTGMNKHEATIENYVKPTADYLADYLLENGVIVPPCKVGRVIYYHFQFRNKSILPFTRRAKVKKIYCSNSKMHFVVDVELIDAKEKGIMKSFDFADFGKTVFLTKEEAEQALKGGAE